MREILFRGRTKSGEWAFGYYLKTHPFMNARGVHSDWIIESSLQNGGRIAICKRKAVLPETVGQYTGFKDKNGNKVFEGDIILDYINDTRYKYFGTVVFSNGEFELKSKSNQRFCICTVVSKYVVGNIYDNPDFIKFNYI